MLLVNTLFNKALIGEHMCKNTQYAKCFDSIRLYISNFLTNVWLNKIPHLTPFCVTIIIASASLHLNYRSILTIYAKKDEKKNQYPNTFTKLGIGFTRPKLFLFFFANSSMLNFFKVLFFS